MQPILIIVLATAAGVPLGLWLRHNLATLKYRKVDEQDLPDPGQRWWVVWATILAIGSLAAAAALSPERLAYLPLVPLAATGPWLAAVDFDVLRIPNRVLALTAAATMLTIVVKTAATDRVGLIEPAVAALVTGGIFAGVHFATKGGVGFGDVKLAALIGLAVAPLGVGAVWLSILSGSVTGLVWARGMLRTGTIPLAPWLLSGAWLGVLVGFTIHV